MLFHRKFINLRRRSKTVDDIDDSSTASPTPLVTRGLPAEALETRCFSDTRFRSRVCSGVPARPNKEQFAQSPPMDFKALVRASTLRAKETQEIASALAERRGDTVTAVDDQKEADSKPEEPKAAALERGEEQLQVEEGERTGGGETEAAGNAEDERRAEGREKHGGSVDVRDESGETAGTVRSCESASQSHCSKPECEHPKRAYHCAGSVCEIQTKD